MLRNFNSYNISFENCLTNKYNMFCTKTKNQKLKYILNCVCEIISN